MKTGPSPRRPVAFLQVQLDENGATRMVGHPADVTSLHKFAPGDDVVVMRRDSYDELCELAARAVG